MIAIKANLFILQQVPLEKVLESLISPLKDGRPVSMMTSKGEMMVRITSLSKEEGNATGFVFKGLHGQYNCKGYFRAFSTDSNWWGILETDAEGCVCGSMNEREGWECPRCGTI